MTEEQIKHGYDRLDSSLHAPRDAFDRVEKHMRVRRRRRRIGLAAGTAVAVTAVWGYATVALGGSDDGREGVVAVDADPPPYSLVMTRPDGSTFAFEDLTISCRPPAVFSEGPDTVDPSRVYLSSTILVAGKERLTQPFVMIEADVTEQREPRDLSLPIEQTDGAESIPLTLFIADPEGAPDGNEVVSSSGSTGTVRVTRASCDPTPVLELEVDATLASEEQGADGQPKQSLRLEGYVS